jgi:hypothetical protein
MVRHLKLMISTQLQMILQNRISVYSFESSISVAYTWKFTEFKFSIHFVAFMLTLQIINKINVSEWVELELSRDLISIDMN